MSKTWTMQDGTEIAIKDMDDQHLINSIRMLERNAPEIYERALQSYFGASPQGDMAQDALEREFQWLLESEPMAVVSEVTKYKSLVWHAKRRKLL